MNSTADLLRSMLRKGSGIAVAIAVMNVATYGFTVLCSHLLGPTEFGGLASLLGVALVANVPALGLQATSARHAATRQEGRAALRAAGLAATWRTAAGVGLVCLVITPLLVALLDVDPWATVLVAASAVPLTLMGGQAGILQGERRWGWLSGVYLTMGLGRIILGLAIVPALTTTFGAMLAVALGAWLPVVVGWVALRRTHPTDVEHGPTAGQLLRETAANSHALMAFFCLSNADVVVARASFEPHQAGLYAAGLVLTKAVLFLPQFVVVLAFPSMAQASDDRKTHLLPLGLIAFIGLVTTAGTFVLNDLAVTFVGGSDYAELTPFIWTFALLGTVLAMTQLLVYALVAQQHRASTARIWVAVAGVVAVALLADGAEGLVVAVTLVDLVLLLTLVVTVLRRAPAARASSAR